MQREAVFAAFATQRRAIADLIDTLSDGQLDTVSLCAGWNVISSTLRGPAEA